MYIHLINNIVTQLIPDIDPVFPDVPISKRYTESFVDKLIHVEDDANVRIGMKYDASTGNFNFPTVEIPHNEPVITESLDDLKASKIAESKKLLAEWLENNPMQYSDGEYYSVTAEKQALLNGNLASYERAHSAGADYPLKWNATGKECTSWEYADLVALSLAIAAYVAPKVSIQQEIEVRVTSCTDTEELKQIVISYD